jgi:hypothetical protein
LVSAVALVAAACASSHPGQGASHRLFPTHADEAKKVGPGVVRLGFGKIKPFAWSVYAERGRPGGPACFAVRVVGPLHEFPGDGAGGPEASETKCGLDVSRHSQVVTVPTKGGESWRPFDIGVAAYNLPVTRVRLGFSGRGWEEIGTRRQRRDLGVAGLDSLRYAVFAVEGCVSEVQGLAGSRVVANVSQSGCDESPE